jgi:hypothetical protein
MEYHTPEMENAVFERCFYRFGGSRWGPKPPIAPGVPNVLVMNSTRLDTTLGFEYLRFLIECNSIIDTPPSVVNI